MAEKAHVIFGRGQSAQGTTPVVAGKFYMDKSEHPGLTHIIFGSVFNTTDTTNSATGSVKLYGLYGGNENLLVELTTTGSSPEYQASTNLCGSINDGTILEVKISIDDPTNKIVLGSAELILSGTAI